MCPSFFMSQNDTLLALEADGYKKVNLSMCITDDDFRNFFKPDVAQENFTLIGAALDVVTLIEPQLRHHDIKISVCSSLDIDEPGEAFVYGYPNEFKQIVLNIDIQ